MTFDTCLHKIAQRKSIAMKIVHRGRLAITTYYVCFIVFFFSLLNVHSASAQIIDSTTSFNPITAFTRDVSGVRGADLKDQLLLHARRQGRIRVIVGLAMAMQPENALTASAAQRQADTLRAMQDGVARRILGAAASNAEPFTLIPYMSMFVTADQASALLDDPDVVSVQEDVAQPPLDVQSIPLIHADSLWASG